MLSKTYDPKEVEKKWYSTWEKAGYFHADEKDDGRRSFSVVIPPPNVTGILHIGHVLNNTLQDIIVRKKRMEGFNVLWMPGTDHAGIATQNVVERELFKTEKKTRHDLGREELVRQIWQWKEKYGSTIIQQLKLLGCSCDWERLCFTMDESRSRAVLEVFARLYKKGLIYRGSRIVHWCPRCQTALSDEENIHREKAGRLWHFKYPLADGSGSVTVATTRPETMLGDTAVAVHPEDERYRHLHGKKVRLPLVKREISIVADAAVDKSFGTGCVKITPAHDPNDFAMGERHKLPMITVMDGKGVMNGNAPEKYRGLDRFKCRDMVLEDLSVLGLVVKIDDHRHTVGHCQRCNTVTEPLLSLQWFLKYDAWVKPALDALEKKELRFYPDKWEKTFDHWLTNIKDWCISRQLWWGHRIPAWYCVGDDHCTLLCKEPLVSRVRPDKCPHCGSTNLRQDEDVLDTWFSSWLWPFSTMGWPEMTPTLKKFYPTDFLVTGPDIIFFWVARMVFAGMEFMGKLPFKNVYFTSMVRDMQGRKLSKSLGNSPDPVSLMEKYGADALRYAITSLAPLGQDVRFAGEKCELGRNFNNKLWNTARFTLMHLEQGSSSPEAPPALEDRWILSRYHHSVERVSKSLDEYEFTAALHALYEFTWNELCDWYLEFIKPRLAQGADAASARTARHTLKTVLAGTLKLLHPFIPCVSEEIFAGLKEADAGLDPAAHLIVSQWPKADPRCFDGAVEEEVAFVQSVIVAIRNLRGEKNIPPSRKGKVIVLSGEVKKRGWLGAMAAAVKALSVTETLDIRDGGAKPGNAAMAVASGVEIFLDLEGLVDREAERRKIQKEIDQAASLLSSVEKKLQNESFIQNAPPAVVEKEREKVRTTRERIEKLKSNLVIFS